MRIPFGKITATLLTAVMLAMSAASPVAMTAGAMSDQELEELRKEMAARGEMPGTTASSSKSYTVQPSAKVPFTDLQKKVNSAKQVNQDVVGWLYVPGTNMSEPIVCSTQGNAYYEKRDWKGTHYPNNNYTNFVTTSSYADFRTKWGSTWKGTSKNIVIYGHNWTNLRNPLDIGNVAKHTMMGQLPSYTDQNFAQSNPYIYFSTGDSEGIWKVFSVAYCEVSSDFFYNQANPGTEAYEKLLKEWKARSMYDFDVPVGTNDRILTLSTCTRVYGDHANQRFVVIARLLREGESDSDPVKVTVNADMKKPRL